MLISHKYKFIFIKTSKTAGTSIEIALSKFCGNEDIITTISDADEEIRGNLSYRGPQNYMIPKSRYSLEQWRKFLFKGKRTKYQNHRPAKLIKMDLGGEVWNTYYKFCVERNPWDRFISFYYWENRFNPHRLPSISEFLDSDKPLDLQSKGINLYTIDDEVVVDKVCFYESLEEDLEKVRIKCGLPERLTLPNAKRSFRTDRRNYRNILTNEEAEKIKNLSRREIALFGYQF